MVGPAFPASENMLTAAISRRVAAMLGTEPQAWRSVRGGHPQAGRWLVEDAHGRSAFVKVGATEQTAGWLRAEWHVYSQIAAPFLPAVLGWDNGDAETSPILILEDLSAAHWPPLWSPALIQHTLEALARVVATVPPAGLPLLADPKEAPDLSRSYPTNRGSPPY